MTTSITNLTIRISGIPARRLLHLEDLGSALANAADETIRVFKAFWNALSLPRETAQFPTDLYVDALQQWIGRGR